MSDSSTREKTTETCTALASIEAQLTGLSRHDKLQLVEDLIRQIRLEEPSATGTLDWDHAYGIASGLWGDEDSTAYVARLRDEWPR